MRQSSIFASHLDAFRDVLGPLVALSPVADEGGFAVLRAVIPSGAVVPLHSHADRESFLVIEGEVEIWLDEDWRTYGAGELIEVVPDAPHAIRNFAPDEASLVLVTTARMARFLGEVSAGRDEPDVTPERIEHFHRTSAAYGYWNGSPEHQAAIGLILPAG